MTHIRYKMELRVSQVVQRRDTLSTHRDGSVERGPDYWIVVLVPGHIAIDFGTIRPELNIDDIILLTLERKP